VTGVILASQSAARRALLAGAGVTFEADAASVDEDVLKAEARASGATPLEVAQRLAAAKSLDVSCRREGLVIGADQTLDLDGRLFDKPKSLEEARRHLLSFRGRAHALHSAVALSRAGQLIWTDVASVTMTVRRFSDEFLEAYLKAEGDQLLGCVGAYRLEGWGAQLFDRIEGDYFTVLGLPLLALLPVLRSQGVVLA
jgi:septum formation protein